MKIANITLYGNYNFGNKLQNYAIQKVVRDLNLDIVTIIDDRKYLEKRLKQHVKKYIKRYSVSAERYLNFIKFNKNIKYYNVNMKKLKNLKKVNKKFDCFLIGSDQVWNYNFNDNLSIMLGEFIDKNKKTSFSASFGVDYITDNLKIYYKNNLNDFKNISVRESAGKNIVEELTGRKDIEILVDPTMLLTKQEWQQVSRRPKNFSKRKYILNYFLGELSLERKNAIYTLANKNDWDVINILDPKDSFYTSGPSEFIYLEENAQLICTDSFHSCVFAILMETPFVVFNREDKKQNMNSRLDNLLSIFKLEDRKYNGNLDSSYLKINYSQAYDILEEEKIKAIDFLNRSINTI